MTWYGHVRGTNEETLPRNILEWCPPGGRRMGRRRNSSIQEVTTGIGEKEINSTERINKEEWRIKIKLKL